MYVQKNCVADKVRSPPSSPQPPDSPQFELGHLAGDEDGDYNQFGDCLHASMNRLDSFWSQHDADFAEAMQSLNLEFTPEGLKEALNWLPLPGPGVRVTTMSITAAIQVHVSTQL